MEELEDSFFREVEPLIHKYIEYEKLGLKDKSKETQEKIHDIAKDFIYGNKERMSKEVEEKQKKIAQEKEDIIKERLEIKAYRQQLINDRNAIKDQYGEKSRAYKAKCKFVEEETGKLVEKMGENLLRENTLVSQDAKQMDKLKTILGEIEEVYGDIDFKSENWVYSLYESIAIRQEEKQERMSDGQVYDENGIPVAVEDIETILDIQQAADEKDIQERFSKIEEGFEDLLLPIYKKHKEKLMQKPNLRETLEDLNQMELIDIYAYELQELYQLKNEEKDPKRKEIIANNIKQIENAISQIREREAKKLQNSQAIEDASQEIEEDNIENTETAVYPKTMIRIAPYEDKVVMCIAGEENPRVYNKIEEMRENGQELKQVIQVNYKNGKAKAEPTILGLFGEIGNTRRWSESYTEALEKKDKECLVDKIIYDFTKPEEIKLNNKAMIRQMKRLAKYAEKQGIAEIVEPENSRAKNNRSIVKNAFAKISNIGNKIHNMLEKHNRKRLVAGMYENETSIIEQREEQERKSPRKNLNMAHFEPNHEEALKNANQPQKDEEKIIDYIAFDG